MRIGRWELSLVAAACLALALSPVGAAGETASASATGIGLVDPTTGIWYLDVTAAGAGTSFYYGNPGDVPFAGDWDCDGIDTPGLFRLSDAFAYLRNSNTAGIADIRFFFGNPSDIPLAGDFNGDGCDTLSLYRPTEQRFYIINRLGQNEGGLGAADYSFLFGNPGDTPVIGDWDGDGIDEVGLHRESTGFFYYRTTLDTGTASAEFYFGDPGDRFVAGDWGVIDGVDTPAVFRPGDATFYFRHSNQQGVADHQFAWGEPGWIPVAASASFSYHVDPAIAPRLSTLPGLRGGTPRPVGVTVGPDGEPQEYVSNEVIFRPIDAADLARFLATYGGTVLRDGTALLVEGETPRPGLAPSTGAYLVRVDVSRSPLDDLTATMAGAGMRGHWSYSSQDAARLAALVAREADRGINPNIIGEVYATPTCTVCEHPLGNGDYVDAAGWSWMKDTGLSIGVLKAWRYLDYHGYPAEGVPYVPVTVAVIDTGFWLDETTGVPLGGNKDYNYHGTKPPQIDEVGWDFTAGGAGSGIPGCDGCWHGQMSFGACCAKSRNLWGSAGISGGDVRPLLIKVTGDMATTSQAVYDAVVNNADVINMSLGFSCGWWCNTFGGGNELESYVGSARNVGAIVVAAAGNLKQDIKDFDLVPCELDGVICVGAANDLGEAHGYSAWGSPLDIWAPVPIFTTVTPDSANSDGGVDDVGQDELGWFGGTSCASPFVAGVVAMMKMLNPGIWYAQVDKILADTAHASTDPKVSQGIVNAFAALEAAKPNQPPTVNLTQPSGPTAPYLQVYFGADVVDPEPTGIFAAQFPTTVAFHSNRDGALCTATGIGSQGCTAGSLTLGTHTIIATATDAFGATATDTITIEVVNTLPVAVITQPGDGSVYHVGQTFWLRGYGFDADIGIPDANLSWRSNRDGDLGVGSDVQVSLSKGVHTVTLTAMDVLGAIATDTITVDVQAGLGYPSAEITWPPHNTLVTPGSPVYLVGEAADPEDGSLTGAGLVWTSNLDGFLGTGVYVVTTLSHTPSGCGSQPHTITLTATDSDGKTGTDAITVTVSLIC